MRRDTHAHQRVAGLLDAVVSRAVDALEAAAFWATVLFPLVYVGAFLAAATLPQHAILGKPVLGALLGANVLALVVGHQYRDEG